MSTYDVVVLGLGGMGSAVLSHLARRGIRTVGFEQFKRGHDFGASYGHSRIIRKAYFENPAYVPLLFRAYELWSDLQEKTGLDVLRLTGVLLTGSSDRLVIKGALESAKEYKIPLEYLTTTELHRRYPSLLLERDEVGLFEPDGGVVFPENAINAHLQVAEAHGAQTFFQTKVLRWKRRAGGALRIDLIDGKSIEAEQLAICAGPWLGQVITDLQLGLRVQRNVQVWFKPIGVGYEVGSFPVFLLDRVGVPARLYGFPDMGGGLKAALHGYGETTTPQNLDRTVRPSDIEAVRAALDGFMPGAVGSYLFGKVCMYTMTADEHFLIDYHPKDAGIIIVGGFSGHGYKFCSVVGEIVGQLLLDRTSKLNIDFLSLRRLREHGPLRPAEQPGVAATGDAK